MAFSSAFLRGQAISKQDKEDKLAGVRAILGRSRGRGSAIAPSRVVGGGTALSRVDAASARVAAEERQEKADKMAEERHSAIMEQSELGNEMMKRELALMPTEEEALRARSEKAVMDAYDRSIAAEENVKAVSIRDAAMNDTMDVQRRNRERRGFSDAWQMRNADEMNKRIRGMFPGMESSYRVTDAGGEVLKDSAGTAMQEATADAYPTFTDDGEGNMYVRWPGSNTSVPVDRGDIRQLMYASSPSLEAPVKGKGTAGEKVGDPTGGVNVSSMSSKDQAKFIVDQQKANNDTFKTAIDFANSATGGGDELMGGQEHDPEAWMKSFSQGLNLMSKKSVQKEVFGLDPTQPAQKKLASKKLIDGVASRLEDEIEAGNVPETDRLRRVKEIGMTLRQNFGWQAEKQWLLKNMHWGIPEALNAISPGDKPENVPNLGTGTENVQHYYDKDSGVGMVIDSKLGHAKSWNKETERWEAASPALLRSFRDVLNVKVKLDGQDALRPMLEEINAKLKGLSGMTNVTGRQYDLDLMGGGVEREPEPGTSMGAGGGATGQF